MKRKMHITLDHLKELLRYEPNTGKFFWNVKRNGQHPSGEAGTQTFGNGARLIRVEGVTYTAPNVAWFYMTGHWPVSKITPKDSDPFNVKWDNLNYTAIDVDGTFIAPKSKLGRAIKIKQYRANNSDAIASAQLKGKFGISLQEYETKLVAQNGVCAICEKLETVQRNGKVRRLAVDHDQATGEIRDLLCTNCNNLLGRVNDDPDHLRSAIKYLERHKGANKIIPLRIVKENE